MKNVILGTAGHVDHGKTALIGALTGIDTDRLAEEKKRGITIELGFAHLDFDDGLQVGIVDVPGHEKFIKNMLAGAGGIDLGMLVVAANEGVMPQTVEHLDILKLLGIKDGLVVITKTDLVDEEWLELVRDDIAELVKGSFLENKPVVAVSSYTGQGIEELKKELHELVEKSDDKNLKIPFRLPVDRVFPVDGFGTVVTGTLIEGGVSVGDVAEIFPSGLTAKVRSLQVHGRDVGTAGAGQRVAINLAGIKMDEIARGDVVAKPGSIHDSMMLDAALEVLPDSRRTVKNGSVVHLYHGARVLLAKVVLLDRDELRAGEKCYAQLRLTEPLAAKSGDRFVIRFYSPLETIGGGVILDADPAKHRRNQKKVLEALRIRESGSVETRVVQTLAEQQIAMPDAAKLARLMNVQPAELEQEIPELISRGLVIETLPGRYAAPAVLDSLWESCEKLLGDYHRDNPLHDGMKLAMLRQKLFKKGGAAECDAVLRSFEAEGKIRIAGGRAALSGFEVHLSKRQKAIKEKLLKTYAEAGIEVPSTDDVTGSFGAQERDDARKVLESLVDSGELVMLTPQLILHKQAYDYALSVMLKHYSENAELTLAQFRDLLNTSRKYSQAILEYWDNNKITRKDGDIRWLMAKNLLPKG